MSDIRPLFDFIAVEDGGDRLTLSMHARPVGTPTVEYLEELDQALRRVDASRHRAVLLLPDGPDMFLGLTPEDVTTEARPRVQLAATAVLTRMLRTEAAVIVAARGRVAGFGCSLLLASDMRVVAVGSHLDGREPTTGSPGIGVAWLADRVGGGALASALLLAPAPLETEHIRALATALVPEDALKSRAHALAAAIAASPVTAVSATVRSLRNTPRLGLLDALRYDSLLLDVASCPTAMTETS